MTLLTGSDGALLLGADGDELTDGLAGPDSNLQSAPASTFGWPSTIISQYQNSPAIRALINGFADALDPASRINAFYDNIWNVNTAVGPGLDVWGRIVNVARILSIPPSIDLGFVEAGTISAQPFGQGPFYSGLISTNNYALSDAAYRQLILVKALSNITGCTAPAYNTMLMLLFGGSGRCYAIDLGGMQMLLTFEWTLQAYQVAILTQSNALVRPAGVGLFILQIDPGGRFGFAEAGALAAPFGQGTFFGDPASAK